VRIVLRADSGFANEELMANSAASAASRRECRTPQTRQRSLRKAVRRRDH
jgi:hypothetical protein